MMKLSVILSIGALLVACDSDGGSGPCRHAGKTYANGVSWQCDCNTCTCEDGSVISTQIACADDGSGRAGGGGAGGAAGNSQGGSCESSRESQADGEEWRCDCGTCKCDDGSVISAGMVCPDDAPGGAGSGGAGGVQGGGAGAGGVQGGACESEGEVHAHAESWQCDCNTCWCLSGEVFSTGIACSSPSAGGGGGRDASDAHDPGDTAGAGDGSCEDGGESHANGDSWRCDCNTCTCLDGDVFSTLMHCADDAAGGSGSGGSGGAAPQHASGGASGGGAAGASGSGEGSPCYVDFRTVPDGTKWCCDCDVCSCDDGAVTSEAATPNSLCMTSDGCPG